MNAQCETTGRRAAGAKMPFFEHYLSIWVAPSALIGASNFFERAVAAATSIFGLQSGAALATVAGVLVEIPVMPSVVWIVNKTKPWYEASL